MWRCHRPTGVVDVWGRGKSYPKCTVYFLSILWLERGGCFCNFSLSVCERENHPLARRQIHISNIMTSSERWNRYKKYSGSNKVVNEPFFFMSLGKWGDRRHFSRGLSVAPISPSRIPRTSVESGTHSRQMGQPGRWRSSLRHTDIEPFRFFLNIVHSRQTVVKQVRKSSIYNK